jgi:hypothetical protein
MRISTRQLLKQARKSGPLRILVLQRRGRPSASVKIFGGPDAGVASFEAMNSLGAPGEEATLSRCQFVASIFDQLGT